MEQRFAPLKACIASFAIYLMPLVGPHAVWLLGEHLYARLTRGGPYRDTNWILIECAVAIALQVLTGLLWYWFFARPGRWRWLTLAICVPLVFALTEWAYMVAIPARALIETEAAVDAGNWKTVCAVADMSLATVRSSPDLPLERAGQAWLMGTAVNSYAVLSMPGCRSQPVAFPPSASPVSAPFVVPGGRALFSTWDVNAARNTWWTYDGAVRALPRPPADPNRATPILSTDGNWAAWVEYIPGATVTPLPQQVVIQSLRDEQSRRVSLPRPGRSELVLLGLDMDARELTFYEHTSGTRQGSLTVFGLDGARRPGPLSAEGVDPQATTFLRLGSGWVAWDAYRENEPYRIAWSLPNGRGTRRIAKGRGITAVAVDPGGTYVAVSTTTNLNIGNIKDAVFVLRASDGQEVWRRTLPRYARASVAFLSERWFAYTDWDGLHATTRVLQIPD
jgi:hypothetical protein